MPSLNPLKKIQKVYTKSYAFAHSKKVNTQFSVTYFALFLATFSSG
jgi:hypothetical protein